MISSANKNTELAAAKRNIVYKVIHAIMFLLEQSDFGKSEIWPKKGIKVGSALFKKKDDTLWIQISAVPSTNGGGVLIDRVDEFLSKRGQKQLDQLRLIIDEAYIDGILFKDTFRDIPRMRFKCWFTFTLTTP